MTKWDIDTVLDTSVRSKLHFLAQLEKYYNTTVSEYMYIHYKHLCIIQNIYTYILEILSNLQKPLTT